MDMIIRLLNDADDLNEVSSIYAQSWKHAYRGLIPQGFLDEIQDTGWSGRLLAEGRTHFVAQESGRLIGTASVCASRWEQHADCGEIISIYFLPQYTGRGFGAALFGRCIDELKGRGFKRIILWVLEGNLAARRFYEKNGFVCTGEYRDDNIGGKPVREVLYAFDTGL